MILLEILLYNYLLAKLVKFSKLFIQLNLTYQNEFSYFY